jgi:hypothetical protein
MALLGDRYEGITDITFFMDQVAERGGVASQLTAGSGAAMDQSDAAVEYAAAPSGYMPMGILLNDVVDKDLTQTHLNFHKNEMQKGNKVTLLLEGWVVTDMVEPKITVARGDRAYVGNSGNLTNVAIPDKSSVYSEAPLGRFLSTADADGFVKVYVKMPAQV